MIDISLIILTITLILFLLSPKIFRNHKWYRYIACYKLGWHSYPTFDLTEHDGCSQHAKCKWCGYKGMIDSQGNLF